jgi:hypothetical protein
MRTVALTPCASCSGAPSASTKLASSAPKLSIAAGSPLVAAR